MEKIKPVFNAGLQPINPIALYLQAVEFIRNTTFVITGEGSFFEWNGERIPEKKFLEEHPVPQMPPPKENFDTTKNWMNNKKSY